MAVHGGPSHALVCQQVVELVTDYLEGTLDVVTHVAFEAHLALCKDCTRYLRQMRTTLDAVGRVPLETLSDRTRTELVDAFRDVLRL